MSRIGFDVPFCHSIIDTFKQYKMETFQIDEIPIIDDFDQTKHYMDKNHLTFYVHSDMRSNLAKDEPRLYHFTLSKLQKTLDVIDGLHASVVLHFGKTTNAGSLDNVIKRIHKLNIKKSGCQPYLLMENAAGQGTELGSTLDDIRKFFEEVDLPIGFCLDTQHAFAAGLTRWDTFDLWDEIESIVKINLVHLNDSKVPFGKRVDRHENLKEGFIWKNKEEDFNDLLEFINEQKVDIILETEVFTF